MATIKHYLAQADQALAKGDLAGVQMACSAALARDPTHPHAHSVLGAALLQSGATERGLRHLHTATEQPAATGEHWHNLALGLRLAGRNADALVAARRATGLAATFAATWQNLGNIQQDLGDLAAAEQAFIEASDLAPTDPNPRLNLGLVRLAQDNVAGAITPLKAALSLAPTRRDIAEMLAKSLVGADMLNAHAELLAEMQRTWPDSVPLASALAIQRVEASHPDEAAAVLAQLLGHHSEDAELHRLYIAALLAANQPARALALGEQFAARFPAHEPLRQELGINLLLLQQWERGFAAYEARWQAAHFKEWSPQIPAPRWRGEPLSGTLYLFGEQGIGEQVLALNMLADLGRDHRVLYEGNVRLLPMIQRVLPDIEVMPRLPMQQDRVRAPDIAAFAPLLSCGQLIRRTAADFPSTPGYLLADPARTKALRSQYAPTDGRPLIGLVWRGSRHDMNAIFHRHVIDDLLHGFATIDARWVDMEYGEDRPTQSDAFDVVFDHGIDCFYDLEGLAAMMSACDAVLAINGSAAHLAGGLGIPSVTMLPNGGWAKWYWGYDVDRIPWYPNTRLARMPGRNDWTGLFSIASAALNERLMNKP